MLHHYFESRKKLLWVHFQNMSVYLAICSLVHHWVVSFPLATFWCLLQLHTLLDSCVLHCVSYTGYSPMYTATISVLIYYIKTQERLLQWRGVCCQGCAGRPWSTGWNFFQSSCTKVSIAWENWRNISTVSRHSAEVETIDSWATELVFYSLHDQLAQVVQYWSTAIGWPRFSYYQVLGLLACAV